MVSICAFLRRGRRRLADGIRVHARTHCGVAHVAHNAHVLGRLLIANIYVNSWGPLSADAVAMSQLPLANRTIGAPKRVDRPHQLNVLQATCEG